MLNVDATVQYWLAQGCPKDKLILGITNYGRSFTLEDESDFGIGAPASGVGVKGELTPEVGVLSYREICYKKDLWTFFRDDMQKTPYAVNGNQWVGFDDIESVAIKLNYVVENDLGGAVFWSLETDDFGKLSH